MSPYEIEDQYFVSSRATLGHGMALPCKVDREDPQRVAIHWDAAEREAEQSTQAPGRARGGPGPGRWACRMCPAPRPSATAEWGAGHRPDRPPRDMRDRGVLTQAEFDVQKAKLLAEI